VFHPWRGNSQKEAVSVAVKIFVYGTLKRGYCRADVLQGQRFLGIARTAPIYLLYDLGAYPGLVEHCPGVEVEGELWEVDEACLRRMDEIEGVPLLYRRGPVELSQPDIDGAQTYLYRGSVEGRRDCGGCWG
jgi:gamma-glutamylcyclotransferase (GGCT)/AIG2-like uncharacterized protein YtfP